MAFQKRLHCIQCGSKHVKPSNSWNWFFPQSEYFLIYISCMRKYNFIFHFVTATAWHSLIFLVLISLQKGWMQRMKRCYITHIHCFILKGTRTLDCFVTYKSLDRLPIRCELPCTQLILCLLKACPSCKKFLSQTLKQQIHCRVKQGWAKCSSSWGLCCLQLSYLILHKINYYLITAAKIIKMRTVEQWLATLC